MKLFGSKPKSQDYSKYESGRAPPAQRAKVASANTLHRPDRFEQYVLPENVIKTMGDIPDAQILRRGRASIKRGGRS